MSTIVDSYSESNQTSSFTVGDNASPGQTFTGNGATIDSAVFYLRKNSAPTGNVYARLYATTGTYGTSSCVPTGSALASSAATDITTFSTSYSLVTFPFTTSYTLDPGVHYAVILDTNTTNFTGGTLSFGQKVGGSHPGNRVNFDSVSAGAYVGSSTIDLCFYVYGNQPAIPLVDYYTEANVDDIMDLSGDFISGMGQSVTSTATQKLYSAKFYIKKVGTITGNAYAKLYNYSGTPGSNALPSGSALATSDPLDVSTLSTSYALKELKFTGANAITLSAANYVLTLEYSGGGPSGTNFVGLGTDSSSPAHSGNSSYYAGGSWTSYTQDMAFYLYSGSSNNGGGFIFFL